MSAFSTDKITFYADIFEGLRPSGIFDEAPLRRPVSAERDCVPPELCPSTKSFESTLFCPS